MFVFELGEVLWLLLLFRQVGTYISNSILHQFPFLQTTNLVIDLTNYSWCCVSCICWTHKQTEQFACTFSSLLLWSSITRISSSSFLILPSQVTFSRCSFWRASSSSSKCSSNSYMNNSMSLFFFKPFFPYGFHLPSFQRISPLWDE